MREAVNSIKCTQPSSLSGVVLQVPTAALPNSLLRIGFAGIAAGPPAVELPSLPLWEAGPPLEGLAFTLGWSESPGRRRRGPKAGRRSRRRGRRITSRWSSSL
jgi:hypothetical protein